MEILFAASLQKNWNKSPPGRPKGPLNTKRFLFKKVLGRAAAKRPRRQALPAIFSSATAAEKDIRSILHAGETSV